MKIIWDIRWRIAMNRNIVAQQTRNKTAATWIRNYDLLESHVEFYDPLQSFSSSTGQDS